MDDHGSHVANQPKKFPNRVVRILKSIFAIGFISICILMAIGFFIESTSSSTNQSNKATAPVQKLAPKEEPTKTNPRCVKASKGLMETITSGLIANDGSNNEISKSKVILKTGYVVHSQVNEDRWYVAAPVPVPEGTFIGVWIVGATDGSSFTVSADSGTATISNFPNGEKSPVFKDISGRSLDIVNEAVQCVPA